MTKNHDEIYQEILQLLADELERSFNNRMKYDDRPHIMEYYKGYHCAVGDLKKQIIEIINKGG